MYSGVYVQNVPITSTALAALLTGNALAGIEVVATYYLGGDMASGVVLPFPSNLEAEAPFVLRIHGPTEDQYLEGDVDAVTRARDSFYQERRWDISVDGGVTTHGDAWNLEGDLTFSFVGRGQPQPVAEATKTVWAQLLERPGADVGIVGDNFGGGEGAQERVSMRIRYDPALAIAKEFTDDLGRRWFATSTRTEDRRRWLIVEGIRLVAGIDLPEFGADA